MDNKTSNNKTNNEHSENKQEYIYEEYIDTGNFPLLGVCSNCCSNFLICIYKKLDWLI